MPLRPELSTGEPARLCWNWAHCNRATSSIMRSTRKDSRTPCWVMHPRQETTPALSRPCADSSTTSCPSGRPIPPCAKCTASVCRPKKKCNSSSIRAAALLPCATKTDGKSIPSPKMPSCPSAGNRIWSISMTPRRS